MSEVKDWMAEYDARSKACVEANRAAILDGLTRAGAVSAWVFYQGAGDSGMVEDMEISTTIIDPKSSEPTEGRIDLACVDVTIPFVHYGDVFEHKDGWRTRQTSSPAMPLKDALDAFCEDYIGATGHDGYENDEGGQGHLLIDVAAATFKLHHEDNYMETNDYDEELT